MCLDCEVWNPQPGAMLLMEERRDALITDPMAFEETTEKAAVSSDQYNSAVRRIQELVRERDTAVQSHDEREAEFEAMQHSLRGAMEELEMLRSENQGLHRANAALESSQEKLVEWARDEQERHDDTRCALKHLLEDSGVRRRDPTDVLDQEPEPFFSRERP